MAGTFPTEEDLCITRWQNWSDAWQTLTTGQENAVHTKKEVKELNQILLSCRFFLLRPLPDKVAVFPWLLIYKELHDIYKCFIGGGPIKDYKTSVKDS